MEESFILDSDISELRLVTNAFGQQTSNDSRQHVTTQLSEINSVKTIPNFYSK